MIPTDQTPLSPATLAIHAGREPSREWRPVAEPIVLSSVFEREFAPGEYDAKPVYGRAGNPNREAFEQTLAALEGGAEGFAYASGIAALNALLHTLPINSRVVVPLQMYHGTRLALRLLWGDRLQIDEIAMSDNEAVRAAFAGRPAALVWLETPSNPLLEITDLATVIPMGKAAGALVAVDNTWATPLLQRPLESGADIAMHSTAKYIGGHSDLVGGALIVRERGELSARLRLFQWNQGAVPSPFDCWLARRGLATMGVRMRAHCENAQRLAEWLAMHPRVASVYYPGLKQHERHEVAARQMKMFGGVVSVRLESEALAREIPRRMKIFHNTTSLGGVESILEHRRSAEGPASPTPPDLIRISVGIEEFEDLRRDLEQALV